MSILLLLFLIFVPEIVPISQLNNLFMFSKSQRKRGHQLFVDIVPVKKEVDGKKRIIYRITIDDEFSRGKIR